MTLLANLRVLDFSRYIAGPYCASILADLGAEVIRVEPVEGGEDRRLVPVTAEGAGALFLQLNRNKKSLAIDANAPAGRAAIERLVATADVAVTNMPLAALARQGLDYASLRAIRPDIIATNLSAFGTGGPLATKTGFDAVAQGVSGAAYLSGTPGRPARSASSYVDYGTGLAAALGTLAAIIHRMATGEGQEVHASLLATAMTFINAAHIEAAASGRDREPFDNRSPFTSPSDFVQTRDGTIAVQVVGNAMFRRWVKLLDRPELGSDPRFRSDSDRGRNGVLLSRAMQEWAGALSTAEAIDRLEKSGIPAGPILTPLQALRSREIMQSGTLARQGLPIANLIVGLSKLSTGEARPAPAVGADTNATLVALGFTAAELSRLRDDGLIGDPA